MAEFLIEVTEQEVGIVIGLHDHEKTAPQRVVISVQVLTRDVTGRADDHRLEPRPHRPAEPGEHEHQHDRGQADQVAPCLAHGWILA